MGAKEAAVGAGSASDAAKCILHFRSMALTSRYSCLTSANLGPRPPSSPCTLLHVAGNTSYYVRFAFHLPLLVSNLRHALPISLAVALPPLSLSFSHSLYTPLSLHPLLCLSFSISIESCYYISVPSPLALPVRVVAPGLRVTILGPSVDTFAAPAPLSLASLSSLFVFPLPPLFPRLATCFVIFIGSEVLLSILALICKWRT